MACSEPDKAARAAGSTGAGMRDRMADMRLRLVLLGLLATAIAGTAASTTAVANARPAPVPAPTQSIVVRPVTSTGHAASGFHVTTQHNASIDCSSRFASPGAVDRNIEECSPSAAYAIACWKAATAHHSLCMRNPSSHRLYKVQLTAAFAKTGLAKPKSRAPLLVVLTDGTRCSIRDGGAWGQLKEHPTWFGTYSCTKHGVVWSPPHEGHYGINESASTWTLRTGSASGKGTLTVRKVERAYFVGTAKTP
jgi:hypothetical protein